MDNDEYLTTDDVARILKVSPELLRQWRHKGVGIPYIKVGAGKKGVVRYSMKDLCNYVLNNKSKV